MSALEDAIVVSMVVAQRGEDLSEIVGGRRWPELVAARHWVMGDLSGLYEWSSARIARAMHLDHTTVLYHLSQQCRCGNRGEKPLTA